MIPKASQQQPISRFVPRPPYWVPWRQLALLECVLPNTLRFRTQIWAASSPGNGYPSLTIRRPISLRHLRWTWRGLSDFHCRLFCFSQRWEYMTFCRLDMPWVWSNRCWKSRPCRWLRHVGATMLGSRFLYTRYHHEGPWPSSSEKN